MDQTGITRLLRSAARENVNFHDSRNRILNWLLTRDEYAEPLSEHLTRKFLTLRAGWKVLNFNEKDWSALRLLDGATPTMSQNIVKLAVDYIRVNRHRVQRLIALSDAYSDALLGSDPSITFGHLDSLDFVDLQCLYIFKLQGGLRQNKHDEYVDYIRHRNNSKWVRRRFLYPLVYHSLNTPTDTYLDTYLSYMIPQEAGEDGERSIVKHLLRDDLSFDSTLVYRSVIGLACHPFDLLESFTNHFEIKLSAGDEVAEDIGELARTLADEFPESRMAELVKYSSDRLTNTKQTSHDRRYRQGKLPEIVYRAITEFTDVNSPTISEDELPNEEWRALFRMRSARYPNEADFDHVTTFTLSFHFMEAGRLFRALNFSMYMLPREAPHSESRELLRLHHAAGRTTPYVWAAPRGDALMAAQLRADGRSWLGADLQAGVALQKREQALDRTWIHSVHWDLRRSVRSGHIRNWLKTVRAQIPMRPRYLTGIDWSWIDKVLLSSRITPFRDNPDGPYALLLRDVEEQVRDFTLLRTAIEPQKRGLTCGEFVEALIAEYGHVATGFVRLFLTADNIMLLGLAPNMTAALSERISALETCAATLKFGELLSEDQLRVEQQTLTSALMLLNVNANQFDIPWASFKRDAADRQRDNYNTFTTFRRSNRTLELVNDELTIYSHMFANGRAVSYRLATSSISAAMLVFGAIDAFYDHPSYGVEAILSTRFRHDTLRREYVSALNHLKEAHIFGIMPQEQSHIVDEISGYIIPTIDGWLSRRMQTLRPGQADAVFDFTPTPAELTDMIEFCGSSSSIEEMLDKVAAWISDRLDSQLISARESFSSELKTSITAAVQEAVAHLGAEYDGDPIIVSRVSSAVHDTLARTGETLLEWFRRPDDFVQKSLSYIQLKSAVEGRFEGYVRDRQLSVSICEDAGNRAVIKPEHVKLYFDMLSEIVANALKYSGKSVVRVRIRAVRINDRWGHQYSTFCSPSEPWARAIPGHRYQSLTEALFREGNSGLDKIAALASSLLGDDISIIANRKRRAFHLWVPLSEGMIDHD